MYIVKLKNGNVETTIHSINGYNKQLQRGEIVKGINQIDSFSFSLLPNNRGFNLINEFTTLVRVYNTHKQCFEFYGRVLQAHNVMESSGKISKEVVCESYLGFLCDSEQTYVAEKNWTVLELFTHLIDTHNAQVEDYKQFVIGEVTVTDANDNLYLGIQRTNTWETINEKLIDKLGGEIQFRVVDDVIYIDYLQEIGTTRTTEIKVSRNMISISRESDSTGYITQLVPLGAKIKDADGNETEERLDITSVNDGIEYIEDKEALALYGIHRKSVTWDNVTTASALLTKGQNYLAENNKVKIKYSVNALDLSLLGLDIDDFEVCDRYPLINELLGIDDIARIVKKKINVCEPTKNTIELGDSLKRLSDLQREQEKNFANLQQTITYTKNELKEFVNNKNSDTVNSLQQTFSEQYTALINTFEEIMLQAVKDYTTISDFESYKETLATELKILADGISAEVTQRKESLEEINGILQSQINEITKYFTFDINGLTIGQVDNPNKVVIDNDEISILVNNNVVQKFDSNGNALIPELQITRKLNLFGFVIEQDENGNVNCEKVGG